MAARHRHTEDMSKLIPAVDEPTAEIKRSAKSEATRARLRAAARETVHELGLADTSARTIAARAEINQALIFYHFHSVSELLEAASDEAIEDSISHYRPAFDAVGSVDDLLGVARELHAREAEIGNVAFMAQILSGAQHDPVLARAAGYAVQRWSAEVEAVLDRLLADGPTAGLIDTGGLAHLVAAGFIGIELYGAVDEAGAARAIDTLASLGSLVDVLNGLGPVTRRAVRAKLRR